MKHLIQRIITAVFLLITLQANAANGFYVGGGVGANNLFDRVTVSENGNLNSGNTGFIGGIFAGYDWQLPYCYDLALEVFGDSTTARIKDYQTSNQASLELKYRYNYGLRVLPGYRVSPNSVVYLVLGGVDGHFKMTDSGYYSVANDTFNTVGYQLGIGASSALWKNLSLRGDGIYTSYNANSLNGSSNINYHNNISTIDVMLSLSYKF